VLGPLLPLFGIVCLSRVFFFVGASKEKNGAKKMQDSHHDPLLPKIAACREKTAEIIASLQGYHKQDDMKEFIQGLRAIENQLDQAYNMKKLLRGYNILDADPLGRL